MPPETLIVGSQHVRLRRLPTADAVAPVALTLAYVVLWLAAAGPESQSGRFRRPALLTGHERVWAP
jgi:hypothetical protein